jgi:hypothetical protein
MGIWAEPEEAARLRREFVIPSNISPIDYLLGRMRDPQTEEHARTRIAIALLPFTSPKLAVTALVTSQDIAARLERAKLRADSVRVLTSAKEIEAEQIDVKPTRTARLAPDHRFIRRV